MLESDFKIREKIESIKEDVISWRRHIHMNPELSFKEFKTSQFIFNTLKSFNDLELSKPTETSVMACLKGALPGPVVAFRADMDALAMSEDNSLEYSSINSGVMHACGHDAHTAMLLGAAKILSEMRESLKGEIRFIFQHAEELPPGGAVQMVEAGVMDGVDRILGLHVSPLSKSGMIDIGSGALTADGMNCLIKIKGKGGHSSMPEHSIDPVSIGAQVVLNLQHIVSRNTGAFENLVLSTTRFNTPGEAYNVIPEYAELGINARGVSKDFREKIPTVIERIVKGVTEAHNAEYEMSYEFSYLPVINCEKTTDIIKETMERVYGGKSVQPFKRMMGGEDFSAFSSLVPGCFAMLGVGCEEKGCIFPNHHPRFNVDEDALPMGVGYFVFGGLKLLESSNGRDGL